MSKTTLFHGTSADNLADILRNGLRTDCGGRLWSCSGNALYFWSPTELVKHGESEAEYADERAKHNPTSPCRNLNPPSQIGLTSP